MLLTFKKLFFENNFIRSSGFLFLINLSAGVFNFGLTFWVNSELQSDFSRWSFLTGILNILAATTSGLSLYIISSFSKLEHNQPHLIKGYYNWILSNLKKYSLRYGFPLVFILTLILAVLNVKNNLEIGLVILFSFLNLFVIFNLQFLLGIDKIKNFAILTIVLNFTKLVFTLLLINSGFNLLALPLGLFASGIITYFLSWYLTYNVLSSHPENPSSNTNFALPYELSKVAKASLALQGTIAILNLGIIASEIVLPEEIRYEFTTGNIFGQMIHFGSIAALGAFVAHSAKKENISLYVLTCKIIMLIAGLATGGVLASIYFGPIILNWINNNIFFDLTLINNWLSTFQPFLNTIFWIGLFTIAFELIYVSSQYLISHNRSLLVIKIVYPTLFIQCFIYSILNNLFQELLTLQVFLTINFSLAFLAGLIFFYVIVSSQKEVDNLS